MVVVAVSYGDASCCSMAMVCNSMDKQIQRRIGSVCKQKDEGSAQPTEAVYIPSVHTHCIPVR